MDCNVICKRLKLLQEDFNIDPIVTIQSFIGIDANIVDYKVNNIYVSGYVIVDVYYKIIELNPNKIYWIDKKECKRLNIKKQNTYIAKVDNIPVCVTLNNSEDKDKIPITINITIPSNRDKQFYNYFGTQIDSPFHDCNSQIFVYEHNIVDIDKKLQQCSLDVVLFKESTIQNDYDRVNDIFVYRSTVQKVSSSVVTIANNIEECNDVHKLYIMDIRNIDSNRNYSGYLACVKHRRHPFDVVYIYIPNYVITKRKLNYMKLFMYNDYINYEEWVKNN